MMGILILLYIFTGEMDSASPKEAYEWYCTWPIQMNVPEIYTQLTEDETEEVTVEKAVDPVDRIMKEVGETVKEYQATLMLLSFDANGIAILDCGEWFKKNYGISYTGEKRRSAVVREESMLYKTGVEDGILFPSKYKYQVLGSYSEPKILAKGDSIDYYYSYLDYKRAETDYMCVMRVFASSKEAVDAIQSVLQENGVMIQASKEEEGHILSNFFRICTADGIYLLLKILWAGILVLVSFSVYLYCKAEEEKLWVHHLYGQNCLRQFASLEIKYAIACMAGFMLGLGTGEALFHIRKVGQAIGNAVLLEGIILILITGVHIAGYMGWYGRNVNGGGC